MYHIYTHTTINEPAAEALSNRSEGTQGGITLTRIHSAPCLLPGAEAFMAIEVNPEDREVFSPRAPGRWRLGLPCPGLRIAGSGS